MSAATTTPKLHRRAADYLAYTLVTGWRPTHMRVGSSWSGVVLLGTNLAPVGCRWLVDEKYHAELAGHPFVTLSLEYKGQGFELLDRTGVGRVKRLISRGIPMKNYDTGQEITIYANGRVSQTVAPGGKWQYIYDIRKGGSNG